MFKKNFISGLSISFLIYPISFFNQLLTSYFFGTDDILDLYCISMSTSILITIHIAQIKEVITREYFSIHPVSTSMCKKVKYIKLYEIWFSHLYKDF